MCLEWASKEMGTIEFSSKRWELSVYFSLSLSFPCDTIDKFLTVFIAQTQLYADNKYRRKFKRKMILEDTRVHGRKKV